MKLLRGSFAQSTLLTVGTVTNSLLGLLFYLLVARSLGLGEFGRFSFLLGIGMMAAEIGDWGLGSAIVKFGADAAGLRKVVSLNIFVRALVLVVFALAAVIATVYLKDNYLLAFTVAASLSFLSIITQAFLASQKYIYFVATNIFGNLLRLLLTILLLSTVDSALLIFSGANFIALFFGIAVLFSSLHGKLLDWSDIRGTWRKVVPYSKWLGGSFALASVAAKIDIPAVYFLAGGQAAGVYSSAQKLTSVLPQIGAAIEGVFAPKLSGQEKTDRLVREYLVIVLLGMAGLAIVIPFSDPILTTLWGSKYAPATEVFQLLLVGMIFFFLSGPFVAAILYRLGKSNVHFLGNVIQLLTSVSLYLLLVPEFGAMGAAFTFIVAQAVSLLFFLGLYFKLKSYA